jgi:hypothetical protein
MYRTFEKDKILKPMPREEEPEAKIFENQRASGALLQFLRQTEVGCAKGETKRIAVVWAAFLQSYGVPFQILQNEIKNILVLS